MMISKFLVLSIAIAAVLTSMTISTSGTADAKDNCSGSLEEGNLVCSGGSGHGPEPICTESELECSGGSGGHREITEEDGTLSGHNYGGEGRGGEDLRSESGGCGGQFAFDSGEITDTRQGKTC
jgi:hypothetical protein